MAVLTVDPATFAKLVVDAVRNARMEDRVTVQSFDWRTLVEVKRLAPGIPTACLTIETADHDTVKPSGATSSAWTAGLDLRNYANSVPRLAQAAGCNIWVAARGQRDFRLRQGGPRPGMQVLPWTVNDPVLMTRLIDQGVDGLITDYPDRLRKVMADRDLALP